MTTTVSRTFQIDASVDDVWSFIADPQNRARALGVVEEVETKTEGIVWRLELPVVPDTLTVTTRDVEISPPHYVQFSGRSKAFDVRGAHRVEPAGPRGCTVASEFTVDGKLPGVESYFESHLDDEIDNLRSALSEHLNRARIAHGGSSCSQ